MDDLLPGETTSFRSETVRVDVDVVLHFQEIWWSLYLGREFSLNIANASIPIPTPENLPRDDIPGVLPEVDDVPRPTLYNEGFVE